MLGLPQTFTAQSSLQLANRISAAVAYRQDRRDILHQPSVPCVVRILAAHRIAQPVLLWGSETFTLTHVDRRNADTAQRRLLRSVARIPRQPDEDKRAYLHRCNAFINPLIEGERWSQLLDKRKFKFAGHVVRHVSPSTWPQFPSLVSEVIFWRSLDEQRRDRLHDCELIKRVGKPIRWEADLWDWCRAEFNTSWLEVARTLTTEQWLAQADNFDSFLQRPYHERRSKVAQVICPTCFNLHDYGRPMCWQGPAGFQTHWVVTHANPHVPCRIARVDVGLQY